MEYDDGLIESTMKRILKREENRRTSFKVEVAMVVAFEKLAERVNTVCIDRPGQVEPR